MQLKEKVHLPQVGSTEKTEFSLQPASIRGKLFFWLLWVVSLGMLLALIVAIGNQFVTPSLPRRLAFEQDIPLPGALPDTYRTSQHPFAPGVAVFFDRFDFQVLDPQTHLLFIAHTGPNPDKEQQINQQFNPSTDAKTDGNIIIFDTQQKKVVGLLNIPQVSGIVLAPDLRKVYAADANDSIVYAIDEQTLQATPIQLAAKDTPDALEYDQTDHLIFVSNPGSPANPKESNIVDRRNQNETIIDARTDTVIKTLPLGVDGQWGDGVGHVRFDPGLHRAFVVVQQLPNPDDPRPDVLPPPGTARLVEIDPTLHHQHIIKRLTLPDYCIDAHGMAIDTEQHIALIACTGSNSPNLVRVDLQTMQVIAEPPWPLPVKTDMLVFDHPLHLLYIAGATGLTMFKVEGRTLERLGSYTPGINTHSIAVNEETHEIYLPLIKVGGRPVLRIMQYNPQGV